MIAKEEIENRIIICEQKVRDYLEVGNTKTAERYNNEIHKWVKMLSDLELLDERKIKELLDYKKGYFNLEQQNQKYKEVIDKANKKLNNFIECCKAEKLESGSDYLHHQYWDMFERFNKQIKDILKEME